MRPAPVLAARLAAVSTRLRRNWRGAGPGPDLGYRLRPDYDVPPLMFTAMEVEAMVAGLRLLKERKRAHHSNGSVLHVEDGGHGAEAPLPTLRFRHQYSGNLVGWPPKSDGGFSG